MARKLPSLGIDRSRFRRAQNFGKGQAQGASGHRVLVVTNDFPPRCGGIESFVKALSDRLVNYAGGDSIVVYTAAMPGAALVDAELPYPVIRDRSGTLLPTPRVRRAVVKTFKKYGCDRVLVGSSVPLGLLAPTLRAAGAQRIVALTHGHEVLWAKMPVLRQMLQRVAGAVDYLTAVTKFTRRGIGRALPPAVARAKQVLLPPGVDVSVFHPDAGGAEVRASLGIPIDAPVVVCVARAMPLKGQDRLISAWPQVLDAVPDARLVLVGDGKMLDVLHRQAEHLGLGAPAAATGRSPVVFVGAVPWEEVPAYMSAGDVFVMLCRSNWWGRAEGIGTVFLEAAACGKPVIVGRSGGAPETVVAGVTGYVVNPNDLDEGARRIIELLQNPSKAREMGALGQQQVVANYAYDAISARCAKLLDL